MDNDQKTALLGLGLYGLIVVVNLIIAASIVYVVYHFVSKFW